MQRMIVLLLGLMSFFSLASSHLPLEDFARHATFKSIKISPTGQYLGAVLLNEEGERILAVLDRENGNAVKTYFTFKGPEEVGSLHWANDERLVLTLVRRNGGLDAPTGTGELFALNADGSRKIMLFGMRAAVERRRASGEVVHWLKDDPKHILIQANSFTRGDATFSEIYKLNIYSGRRTKVTRAPVRYASSLADHDGNVRFAIGESLEDSSKLLYYREQNGEEWQLLKQFDDDQQRFLPLGFMADNNRVIALASDQHNTTLGVVALDLATGKEELLFRDERVDAYPILGFEDGYPTHVIGAGYEPGFPEVALIDPEHDSARMLKGLLQALPGKRVSMTSQTRDGNLIVIAASSDRDPGTYYLFDKRKGQLSLLMKAMPWLKVSQLAKTESIDYKARDGQSIQAYLTLPKGKQKGLPLILHPHGGPHGPRDQWRYSPVVKMLADRGYAVLQPNFRGSGGFGSDFQSAGYRKWGTLMIDDMVDGVQHLIEQGIVDKDRICVYGASYGGYAALMNPIRYPDLFKCTIGYVGVYDLKLMYKDGDIEDRQAGINYLEKVLGRDEKELEAQSAVYNVDKLKAPVFIVHGGKDYRVPISHAEALRDALDKKGHPYEWLVKDNEMHGFYKPEHNVELWTKMLAFLDKHIGH
ncbi:S9 family peptidase [Gallaecimonas sp. GXIMD4217]|uniref:alpha/beta hydrolase family protein n=1 Tax=Gallaecimonas sp. GXIMD4217 TaxID=3131927 RepID=UPI00311AF2A3